MKEEETGNYHIWVRNGEKGFSGPSGYLCKKCGKTASDSGISHEDLFLKDCPVESPLDDPVLIAMANEQVKLDRIAEMLQESKEAITVLKKGMRAMKL